MSVRGLLCSGLNASILLAVVYGVIVDEVTYWAYRTAHFIGRAEEMRGVCLTHRCSPAMCVTLRQWHAELDFAERVSWVNEPKGRSLRHTLWHKPIDRHTHTNTWACTEKQTLLPLFSNLSLFSLPVFCSFFFSLSQQFSISAFLMHVGGHHRYSRKCFKWVYAIKEIAASQGLQNATGLLSVK